MVHRSGSAPDPDIWTIRNPGTSPCTLEERLTMLWFVCFEIAPKNAFGIWERKGMTSQKSSKDDAIAEITHDMAEKYGPGIRLVDVFQYEESEQ
jgi:hypothetical protein